MIDLESEITRWAGTRSFEAAKSRSSHAAVCLLGHPEPVQYRNRALHPKYIRVSKTPEDAAKEFARAHAVNMPEVLAYVWTMTTAHGNRLKSALDALILGDDPAMIALNGGWRDWMDWQDGWRSKWTEILVAAVAELRHGGEEIETFDDRARARMLLRDARKRITG